MSKELNKCKTWPYILPWSRIDGQEGLDILHGLWFFGLDERLVASALDHYLEQPDDAAIAAASDDPAGLLGRRKRHRQWKRRGRWMVTLKSGTLPHSRE